MVNERVNGMVNVMVNYRAQSDVLLLTYFEYVMTSLVVNCFIVQCPI